VTQVEESTMVLNGRVVADQIKDDLKTEVEKLKDQGITPCLATVLVGNDPSSATYVRMKGNACRKIGMESIKIHLPEETTTEELLATIDQLNNDDSVHGILLQHPVPPQIDERKAFDQIAIEKDVDGVTTEGFGQIAFDFARYPSCTPAAILQIIDYYQIPLEGKHAVVIGRSPILGKPVSMMLLNRNATVTICHSKTENIADVVRQADILVAAVGYPNFVKGDWVKDGVVILDAGYNDENVGDVEYDACAKKATAITPVPGGVGPVTISMLLKHTVLAAKRQI
jgi:methylenetetrahydrofolate dehydrogenase (NADP+) / methenyltetrahydrofolate cyclohydrolase